MNSNNQFQIEPILIPIFGHAVGAVLKISFGKSKLSFLNNFGSTLKAMIIAIIDLTIFSRSLHISQNDGACDNIEHA